MFHHYCFHNFELCCFCLSLDYRNSITWCLLTMCPSHIPHFRGLRSCLHVLIHFFLPKSLLVTAMLNSYKAKSSSYRCTSFLHTLLFYRTRINTNCGSFFSARTIVVVVIIENDVEVPAVYQWYFHLRCYFFYAYFSISGKNRLVTKGLSTIQADAWRNTFCAALLHKEATGHNSEKLLCAMTNSPKNT